MNTHSTTATLKTGKLKIAKPLPKAKVQAPAETSGKGVIKPKPATRAAAKPSIPTKPRDPLRTKRVLREIESIVETDLALERISKQAMLIALLRQKGGVTLSSMMAATGWQAHSVRGVISGILRKKLGLAVERLKQPDGTSTYRIAA